jgi:uncharacterized protein (TIGR04141 family)
VEKTKKEKFSIYLARDILKEHYSIIKIENTKDPITIEISGLDSCTLYIKKGINELPSWTELFREYDNINDDDFNSSSNVGAVFIVQAFKKNLFSLSEAVSI